MVISLDRRNFKLSLVAAGAASFGRIGQELSKWSGGIVVSPHCGEMLRFGCANLD